MAKQPTVRIASAICVHDDNVFLAEAVRAVKGAGPCFAFVSRLPWSDLPGDWQATAEIARLAGAKVVVGDWESEQQHRTAALDHLRSLGFTHAIIPDSDEIVEPR